MPRSVLFLVLIALVQVCTWAQEGNRYTEEEVSIEKMFIEAKKHKLLGDLDGAKELFGQLIKKYRNHDVAAYELAELYLREEEFEDALYYINLALGNESDNKWYLLLKADILKSNDRFLDAAEVYDRITKLEPRNMSYLEQKAYLYSKADRYERSIEIFDEMERRIGVTEKSALIKHDFYKKLGKKSKALQELIKLTEHFPKDIGIKHILANYYNANNKSSAAKEVYQEILDINPNDARANVAMASTFKKQGNHSNYLNSIRPIIENEEAGIDIKIAELMPYVKKAQKNPKPEELESLLVLLSVLEKTHPEEAKSYALHGDILSLAGKSEEAIEKYSKTIELDESNYLVWEQLLMLQAEVGQMENLAATSAEAMELFPNQANIFYLNGIGNLEIGKSDQAVESLEQALLMIGSNEDLKFNILALLGQAHDKQKNFEESENAYQSALIIKPADHRLLNDYSFHLAQRGERLDEALKMITKALNKQGTNPRYLASKAWIKYRQQKVEEAKLAIEEALKNGGDGYGYILEAAGDIYYKSDQSDKAIRYWKLAREKGPGSKWLDRKISEEKLIEAQ